MALGIFGSSGGSLNRSHVKELAPVLICSRIVLSYVMSYIAVNSAEIDMQPNTYINCVCVQSCSMVS